MIHSLGRKATSGQIHEMLEVYPTLIKIVVESGAASGWRGRDARGLRVASTG